MQLSDSQYRIVVLAVSTLLVAVLVRVRFCATLELPDKPPKPKVTLAKAKAFTESVARSTQAFAEHLREDALATGVPPVTVEAMAKVFPYVSDTKARSLEPGDSVEVAGLKLTLSVEEVSGSRRQHMVLLIENTSHRPLAYRVLTKPSAGERACTKKQALAHNAVAVAAGGRERRTECVFRKGYGLEITRVETLELPELAYLYVSSVEAAKMGLPERTAAGHRQPVETLACRMIQSETTRNAIESQALGWRDMADFYARHRCKSYEVPIDYKAFQRDGEQKLPAVKTAR